MKRVYQCKEPFSGVEYLQGRVIHCCMNQTKHVHRATGLQPMKKGEQWLAKNPGTMSIVKHAQNGQLLSSSPHIGRPRAFLFRKCWTLLARPPISRAPTRWQGLLSPENAGNHLPIATNSVFLLSGYPCGHQIGKGYLPIIGAGN